MNNVKITKAPGSRNVLCPAIGQAWSGSRGQKNIKNVKITYPEKYEVQIFIFISFYWC
jgi:hypothetical protein